jgi:phytoene dehydrogenase-like protein
MAQEQADIVIVGSGIGGLSCGALLARYGFEVTVCESHSIPGGAAHAFEREGFCFDSGPSLYSGLSYSPSTNPLRQILDAIEEPLPCTTYDTWGCYLPEGEFDAPVGADAFTQILTRLRGQEAAREWRELQKTMEPLAKAAIAIPPAAFRSDWQAIWTLGPFLPSIVAQIASLRSLQGSFRSIMDRVIQDPFTRNWLDLLCFLLSGLPADGTSAAEMAFMFAEWYRPQAVLDYPLDGSGEIVAALVRGLKRYGGKLRLNAHVDRILVENKRAVGVRLKGDREIRAGRAVISNASIWDTLPLLPEDSLPQSFRQKRQQTPPCDSFLHLHLGINAENIRSDLKGHYIVVNDWEQGVTAPQNVVAVSIASVFDPSLAPPGKHCIHAYTPATEPYALWQGMDRRSLEYARQKEERSQVLWQALERIIPDIRSRCEVVLVGTPLTHERFLRRDRGSYGPALRAGQAFFPGAKTPLAGLLCCGDSTFPGIGVPAVAASGTIAAHHLAPVSEQIAMLRSMGCLS